MGEVLVTGGDLVARVLKEAGVGHVFTLCGGHILPIYDGCLTEGIRVIDVRHEQVAAHAADAYARLTRNVGVAVVTAGPGVTDAITGVANAYAARSPLLLIGGAAPLGLRGLGALQEMEQVALLRPITKGAFTVAETRQIPEVLTTAIRTALSGRPGPVFVQIPVDLLLASVEDRLAPIPQRYLHRAPALADPDAIVRLGHREGALGDRAQQRDLLHLLERAESAQAEGRGAADQEQRAPGRVGVGHAGHRVGDAGPRGHDRDPDVPGEPRVGVGGVGRHLLVAHVDHADPLADAAVVDRQDVAAAEREDVSHARFLQHPRDQLAAGHQNFSHRTLLRSRPLAISASLTPSIIAPPPDT